MVIHVLNVHGYNTECLINLQNPDTARQKSGTMEAKVKFDLLYNIMMEHEYCHSKHDEEYKISPNNVIESSEESREKLEYTATRLDLNPKSSNCNVKAIEPNQFLMSNPTNEAETGIPPMIEQANSMACNYCSYLFNSYKDLHEHLRNRFCNKCNTQLSAACQLKAHHSYCYRCLQCKQHFAQKQAYALHRSNESVFTCSSCNETFKNECSWQQHQVRRHTELSQCSDCHSIFNGDTRDKHTSVGQVVCETCLSIFNSQCLLNIHHKYCSKCDHCNVLLRSLREQKRHTMPSLGYYCCSEHFSTLCHFNQHLNTPHCLRKNELNAINNSIVNKNNHTKRPKCGRCNQTFPDQKQYGSHKYRCSTKYNTDGHICPICGLRLTHEMNLKEHIRLHSDKRAYLCDICGKSFKTNMYLRRHKIRHTGIKKFACTMCPKRFCTDSALAAHRKLHTDLKQHKCTICQKGFNRKDYLQLHMMAHTQSKPFKCEICEKEFALNGSLKTHMNKHTGERPYKCDVCGKCFALKGNLKVHSYVHEELNNTLVNHFCDVCHKAFPIKSQLDEHVRLHTGEKPFKCEMCSKTFRIKQFLTNHMLVHSGRKPYKCEQCGVTFTQRGNLQRHYKTHVK